MLHCHDQIQINTLENGINAVISCYWASFVDRQEMKQVPVLFFGVLFTLSFLTLMVNAERYRNFFFIWKNLQVYAYFDITLDRAECSSAPGFIECSRLKIKRVSKQRLLFGNITICTPLDNDAVSNLSIFKKQGGEYRKMPYKIVKPFCDVIKNGIYFYDDLCVNSTLPKHRPCPYPIGTYVFNGYTPLMANFPHQIIPSGDYKVDISFIKGQKELLISITCSIIQFWRRIKLLRVIVIVS